MDDLEVIAPETRVVTYQGEQIEVRPLTVGQWPSVVRAAKPAAAAMVAVRALAEAGEPAHALEVVIDLLAEHGEQLYAAAAVAIGKPEAWVAQGDLAEFLALATAIVEVNRDFFVQTLAPMLAGRLKRAASHGDGPTASSTSSNAATH